MGPISKLVDATLALVEARARITIVGKVTCIPVESLTKSARAHLLTAFEALRAIQVGHESGSPCICERANATLRVTNSGLVHDDNEVSVVVEKEHWTNDPSAALIVNGHVWSLSEMVDGVIGATKGVIGFALGDPVQSAAGARKDAHGDASTVSLLETAKDLIKVSYDIGGPAHHVRAKLAECGINARPVTVAAVIAMLEQSAETCRRAAFPKIDEVIARIECPSGDGAVSHDRYRSREAWSPGSPATPNATGRRSCAFEHGELR